MRKDEECQATRQRYRARLGEADDVVVSLERQLVKAGEVVSSLECQLEGERRKRNERESLFQSYWTKREQYFGKHLSDSMTNLQTEKEKSASLEKQLVEESSIRRLLVSGLVEEKASLVVENQDKRLRIIGLCEDVLALENSLADERKRSQSLQEQQGVREKDLVELKAEKMVVLDELKSEKQRSQSVLDQLHDSQQWCRAVLSDLEVETKRAESFQEEVELVSGKAVQAVYDLKDGLDSLKVEMERSQSFKEQLEAREIELVELKAQRGLFMKKLDTVRERSQFMEAKLSGQFVSTGSSVPESCESGSQQVVEAEVDVGKSGTVSDCPSTVVSDVTPAAGSDVLEHVDRSEDTPPKVTVVSRVHGQPLYMKSQRVSPTQVHHVSSRQSVPGRSRPVQVHPPPGFARVPVRSVQPPVVKPVRVVWMSGWIPLSQCLPPWCHSQWCPPQWCRPGWLPCG